MFCGLSSEFYQEGTSYTSPHSSSTCSTHSEADMASPRARRHSSFSSIQSILESPSIQLLETMAIKSPAGDKFSFELQHSNSNTIAERVEALSPAFQRLFYTCGADESIQCAVLDIFKSHEVRAKQPIRSEMADPMLEKIMYTDTSTGKGKRGAPQFYKCRWGSCSEKMSRKLHAVEHIMTHIDNRPHVCAHWYAY